MATTDPDKVKPKHRQRAAGRLQCQLQAHLGKHLHGSYEPIPGSLLKLLDGLHRKEQEK